MIRYDRKCRHEYNDKSIQNLFIFMKRRKILFKKKKLFDIEEEKYGKRYRKIIGYIRHKRYYKRSDILSKSFRRNRTIIFM